VTELGLGLQTDKRPGEYAALRGSPRKAGFAVVTTFNDLWFQPALPALLEIAAATARVRIGPSCLNPFTLHPAEIAGQVAALDAASDGRAFLGLARGSWLEPLGVDQSDPVTAVAEAWEVVRRLLAADESGFAGRRFTVPPGERLRYPVRRPEVPLLVGTWNRGLAAFAGREARELKVGGSANPRLVPVMRDLVGNDEVGIVLGAVTVVDEDGDRARRLARREVAPYFDVVGGLDPTVSLEPELVARVRDLVRARDHDAAGALIPDDLLERFAFAGTPEEVASHAEAVLRAGARRVDFGMPHGLRAPLPAGAAAALGGHTGSVSEETQLPELLVGRVASVEEHAGARAPSYLLQLELGPRGRVETTVERGSYEREELEGAQVVVALRGEEALVLGARSHAGGLVLLRPDREVEDGTVVS
jgi:5,10-methylenetetrahydromethanopterin reductase